MNSRGLKVDGHVDRSVLVTGDGNTVLLRLGDSGISPPLIRRHHPAPDRRRPASGGLPRELDLLKPQTPNGRPRRARDEELALLQDWADDPADICVHALIGRAGAGKTRLAIAFCRRIDPSRAEPGAAGWAAGFISTADLHSVVETLATRSFDWPTKMLIVVDDAAAGAKPLARWLDRLAADAFKGKLAPVLLLDREAPYGFGRWRDLADPVTDSAADRRDLFLARRPRLLADLQREDERRDLFLAARAAARELRQVDRQANTELPMPAFPACWARRASATRWRS